MSIPVGAPAPAFTTRNQFGQPVSSAGLRGTPLLLVFFPYAFTSVCTGEVRALGERRERIEALGCRTVAISTDTMFTLRVFDEQEELGLTLLTDHWPHGRIASDFGAFDETLGCAGRVSFLIDAEGIVRWHDSSDLPAPRDFEAHLAAIRELLGGPGPESGERRP
ncbi:redoxin domain-containing protein [Enemella sp. A6]|uniref:redoxin domain-containing protein n=1 Tax=Enemella sp. A6 TaxID=3440152 RepID=UPI003EBD25D3